MAQPVLPVCCAVCQAQASSELSHTALLEVVSLEGHEIITVFLYLFVSIPWYAEVIVILKGY